MKVLWAKHYTLSSLLTTFFVTFYYLGSEIHLISLCQNENLRSRQAGTWSERPAFLPAKNTQLCPRWVAMYMYTEKKNIL